MSVNYLISYVITIFLIKCAYGSHFWRKLMIKSIGSKIKQLRKNAHITQQQLCLGFMDRTNLSKIENGKQIPTLEELDYIAGKLNVPINYFLQELQFGSEQYRYVSASSANGIQNYALPVYSIADSQEDSILLYMYTAKDYHGIIKHVEFNIDKIDFLPSSKNIFFYLGMSYFNLELFNKALKYLRKYITLYLKDSETSQKKDVENFASALNTLFKIMLRNKNYEKGEHYLDMANKYLIKYNADEKCLLYYIIISNLGFVYMTSGKYIEAIKLLEDFLLKIDDFICISIIPDIHNCLCISYYNTGNYNMAIEHSEKCIFFYSYIGNSNQAYACYINYHNALRYSKNFAKAIDILNKVKAEVKDNFQLYQRFLMQDIIVNFDLKNYDYIKKNINKINTSNLKRSSLMDYYYIKGHVEFVIGNYTEAIHFLKKCEKYFRDFKFYYDLSVIYDDIYIVTDDERYLELKSSLDKSLAKKNILI